jgi:hypothetical protein
MHLLAKVDASSAVKAQSIQRVLAESFSSPYSTTPKLKTSAFSLYGWPRKTSAGARQHAAQHSTAQHSTADGQAQR